VLIFQSLWETVESVNKNMADWQLTSCCSHTQVAFIATIGAFIFVILAVSVFWACHIVVVVVGKQRELFLDLSAIT
jgi:hypothetical protein